MGIVYRAVDLRNLDQLLDVMSHIARNVPEGFANVKLRGKPLVVEVWIRGDVETGPVSVKVYGSSKPKARIHNGKPV